VLCGLTPPSMWVLLLLLPLPPCVLVWWLGLASACAAPPCLHNGAHVQPACGRCCFRCWRYLPCHGVCA